MSVKVLLLLLQQWNLQSKINISLNGLGWLKRLKQNAFWDVSWQKMKSWWAKDNNQESQYNIFNFVSLCICAGMVDHYPIIGQLLIFLISVLSPLQHHYLSWNIFSKRLAPYSLFIYKHLIKYSSLTVNPIAATALLLT